MIDVALGQAVGTIDVVGEPRGLAVSPDGKRLLAADELGGTLSIFETESRRQVGEPIPTGVESEYVAITPDGSTAFVSAAGEEVVTPVDLATGKASAPIPFSGETADLVAAPDQSPTAAFTAPSATVNVPATFSGAASTDPDGSVVAWNWAFGDGGTATGVSVTHAYAAPGAFGAKLSVVDDEGCGEGEVFTGRTAFCSGAAPAEHPVTVKAAPAAAPTPTPSAAPPPSNKFHFGRLIHDRGNGTARLQVKLPAAGSIVLAGPKVHMVRKKIGGPGSLWLTLHARVELNKKLKKTLRATVRFRTTFTPTGGTSKTTSRSIVLQRAPHKKHR